MLARVLVAHLAATILKGERSPLLRWKLLIIASILASVVGAGTCFAAAYFLLDPARTIPASGWVAIATLLIPVAAITYTGIFVYRHTARRRALQAAAVVLLAALLTLTALLLGSIILGRRTPEFLPAPAPVSKTS